MTKNTTTAHPTLHAYDATFILDTRSYPEPVETLIEKITSTIESIHGTIESVDSHGQKPFARITNRKFPAGIYVTFKISGPSTFPKTLQERFKLDRLINRILITQN